jgi:hypothetical protein
MPKKYYLSSNYHVPASDAKGHNEQVYFRAPTDLVGDMMKTLTVRETPWTEKSEFLRWALVYALEHVRDLHPVAGITKQTQAILDILKEDEKARQYERYFGMMEESINRHLKADRLHVARTLAQQCYDKLKGTAEDENGVKDDHWSQIWLDEFLEHFGALVAVPNPSAVDLPVDIRPFTPVNPLEVDESEA